MQRCKSSIDINLSKEKGTAADYKYGDLQPTSLYLSDGEQRLYLPRRDTAPCSLDVYLESVPEVADRTQRLFSEKNPQPLKEAALSQKCLTVLQGEVAHASEAQTDLLISAEATTCHIVALRSTHNNNNQGEQGQALASMAHVDQPDVYEECLEKMVQQHLQHHLDKVKDSESDDYGFFMDDDDENDSDDDFLSCEIMTMEDEETDSRCSSFLPNPVAGAQHRRSQSLPSLLPTMEPVEMELHIAGGYLDKEGTSQGLSTSLVHSFSRIADKYQGKLKISLSTAAISSMNNSNDNDGPRSRGLALNTHTGEVTPVTTALPSELDGPAMEVRSARLWSSSHRVQPELAVIHTTAQDGITIHPFHYQARPQLDVLLKVPDPVLLKVTSTSPDYESDRFCNDLRRTLSFVNTVPVNQVFGGTVTGSKQQQQQQPLRYSRSSGALNAWERSTPATTATTTVA